jgi:hypothetical protein
MKDLYRRALVPAAVVVAIFGTTTAGAMVTRIVLHASAPRSAVTISGRWTIVVRNQRGKIVADRKFENSFVGGEDLVQVLEGARTVGGWHVDLLGAGQSTLEVDQPDVPTASSAPSRNLTVTELVESGVHELLLQGSATSDTASSITEVMTGLVSCDATVTQAACADVGQASFAADTFTDTTLSPAIALAAGDTVGVTVKIGFTSVAGGSSGSQAPLPPTATTTTATTAGGGQAGVVSAANSVVVVNASTVSTIQSATISVLLRDALSSPLSGKTVNVTAAAGSSQISPVSDATNGSGEATFTVADATPETVVYSAHSGGVAVGQPVSVTFVAPPPAGPVSATTSTVTSSASYVDSGVPIHVYVTLKDAAGNPVGGKTVTLVLATSGAGITTANPTTSALGVVTFVVSLAPGSYTFIAADTTDGITIGQTLALSWAQVSGGYACANFVGPAFLPPCE